MFSGKILLELVTKGVTRNEAYDLVQRAAFIAKKDEIDFIDSLLADNDIRSILGAKAIEEMFDIKYYIRSVDRIFRRVGI